jgi:hypothetical protein
MSHDIIMIYSDIEDKKKRNGGSGIHATCQHPIATLSDPQPQAATLEPQVQLHAEIRQCGLQPEPRLAKVTR